MSNTTGYTVPSYASSAPKKHAQKKPAAAQNKSAAAQKSAPAAVQTQKKQAEAAKTAATAAAATAAPAPIEFSAEKVRDAIVWAEILGEPRCRARHKRSGRR